MNNPRSDSVDDTIAPKNLIVPSISGVNLSTNAPNGLLYVSGVKLCVFVNGVGYAVH